MAFSLVRIVSTLTPVVLGAFDLYRKRREAKEFEETQAREFMKAPDRTDRRIRDLEEAGVEQARLISELSNTLEALVTTLEQERAEAARRDVRCQRLLWAAVAASTISLTLSLVVASR